ADRAVEPALRLFFVRLLQPDDVGIGGDAIGDRYRPRALADHAPSAGAGVLLQVEFDAGEASRPSIRLGHQDAGDRHVGYVAVGVPEKDDVDARNLPRDGDGHVLVGNDRQIRLPGPEILAETHVHRDHDDIDALLAAENGDPLLRLVNGVVELEPRVIG